MGYFTHFTWQFIRLRTQKGCCPVSLPVFQSVCESQMVSLALGLECSSGKTISRANKCMVFDFHSFGLTVMVPLTISFSLGVCDRE